MRTLNRNIKAFKQEVQISLGFNFNRQSLALFNLGFGYCGDIGSPVGNGKQISHNFYLSAARCRRLFNIYTCAAAYGRNKGNYSRSSVFDPNTRIAVCKFDIIFTVRRKAFCGAVGRIYQNGFARRFYK